MSWDWYRPLDSWPVLVRTAFLICHQGSKWLLLSIPWFSWSSNSSCIISRRRFQAWGEQPYPTFARMLHWTTPLGVKMGDLFSFVGQVCSCFHNAWYYRCHNLMWPSLWVFSLSFVFEETCGQTAAVSGQGPTRSTGKVHKVLFVRVFSGRFLIDDDYSSSINLENGDLPN